MYGPILLEQAPDTRQNSEFSTLAAMYKNAVPLTVRRPTVAGDRYAVKGVLSS
jgi:hypothetical protein